MLLFLNQEDTMADRGIMSIYVEDIEEVPRAMMLIKMVYTSRHEPSGGLSSRVLSFRPPKESKDVIRILFMNARIHTERPD
jgi:hypothetical protein